MKKTGITKVKNCSSWNSTTIGIFSTLFVKNTTRAIIIILSFIAMSMVPPEANATSPYSTGRILDYGGSFSRYFSRYIGKGYATVNVQLLGWDLDFKSSDHHIDRAAVKISYWTYNSDTGNVTFLVQGNYNDKNSDDDYFWEVFYTILSLR